MVKNRKTFALLATSCLLSLGVMAAIGGANNFLPLSGETNTYVLNINRDQRKFTTDEISAGQAVVNTNSGNPITFSFDSSKTATDGYSVAKFSEGGYLKNDTPINGISKIELRLAYGSAYIKYGNNKDNLNYTSTKLDTNATSNVDFTVEFTQPSNYFSLCDITGNSYLRSIKITYSCISEVEETPINKTAVFADVQLCYKSTDNSTYYSNLGSTANSPLALKNHLNFAKQQNANVLFMVGDIANNAVEKYYEFYQEIFESVYGTDSSKYPEVIWAMGNHEWWDTAEHNTANAVSLFNQYANIDSPYLVRKSAVKYSLDSSVTLPTYYKVVNGVPYVVISGENSTGLIGSQTRSELASWISEIKNLPSVVAGGPVYVAYHYPLSTTLTHGKGEGDSSSIVEALFADVPTAVIFTGDTHYSGINERSINQVNFTTINLGSSSYSRMDTRSATMSESESFYNMKIKGSKISDQMVGNAQYQYEYTPTIEIMDTMSNYNTEINRYFSNEVGGTKVGPKWNIPCGVSTSTFKYTNARFENTNAAMELYGKTGLNWESGDQVKFGVKDGKMTVKFIDTVDYHFCEHYKITVTSNTSASKTYDVVGTYYKYLSERSNNYYVLEDLPTGTSYTVKVVAYDYFDNPSTNFLTSSTASENECIDAIDNQSTLTYTDISTRVNVEQHVENSNSSVEFYYKGIQAYNYGALLNRVYDTDSSAVRCNDYISLTDAASTNPVLTMKVKNLKDADIKIGVTVVDSNGTWKTDFGAEHQKTVKKSDGWTTLTWNLNDLFGISSKSGLGRVSLKAKSLGVDSINGYEMNFLVDDLDITGEEGIPETPRGTQFEAATDLTLSIPTKTVATDTVVFDVKFTSAASTKIAVMLGNSSNWNNYFGYFDLSANTASGAYNGLTVSSLEDGYMRFSFKLSELTKTVGSAITEVNMIYIRGGWSTATGLLDKDPDLDVDVIRGEAITAGTDKTLTYSPISTSTGTLVIDIKITSASNTHFAIMLANTSSWSNYIGYLSLYMTSKTGDKVGVTVTQLSDGYVRFTIDLNAVTAVVGTKPETINMLYVRGGWTDASGYIDIQ